jgi:hypothetical protein
MELKHPVWPLAFILAVIVLLPLIATHVGQQDNRVFSTTERSVK